MTGCMGLARVWGAAIGITMLVAALPGRAEPSLNTSLFGLAVKGYDVVSYFENGKAEKGTSRFTVRWRDAKWRFASAEHMAAFSASPERYAPQYGGYCAWAMSRNKEAPIDPKMWRIVDGKLYLNYNRKIQAQWVKDIPGFIAKADRFWQARTGPK